MLDENTPIVKPRLCVVDKTCFVHTLKNGKEMFRFEYVLQLAHRLSSHWKFVFVYKIEDEKFTSKLSEECAAFGIHFWDLVPLDNSTESLLRFKDLLLLCDIAYIPQLLPSGWQTRYRMPRNPQQLLEVLAHFSNTPIVFTRESYYAALDQLW